MKVMPRSIACWMSRIDSDTASNAFAGGSWTGRAHEKEKVWGRLVPILAYHSAAACSKSHRAAIKGASLLTASKFWLVGEPPCNVLAFTAAVRNEDRVSTRRAGFQAHLGKPVDPNELVTTILALVGSA